jgi:hypothetical protein
MQATGALHSRTIEKSMAAAKIKNATRFLRIFPTCIDDTCYQPARTAG